jgi:hypothetical protein
MSGSGDAPYGNEPEVYLRVHKLPPLLRPAYVLRRLDITLVWADAGSLRAEVMAWAMDELKARECRVLRAAFEQPDDLRIPIDDALLEGTMETLVIPDVVRATDHAQP